MQLLIRSQVWRRLAEAVQVENEYCAEDDAVDEAGPPPIPPRRPAMGAAPSSTSTSIGAGVTSKVPGAVDQDIKLTIGRRQMSFKPDEFVEMIASGQLQGMVAGGQVRKLPGVG